MAESLSHAQDKTTHSSPVIKVRNLRKVFRIGAIAVQALCDVNLDIGYGEMVSIMGPSGSGKTTLMNIIGCLDVPSAGAYWLDDQDVSTLSDNQLANIRCHKIGFVFQHFNLLARTTAVANVELPLLYANVRAKERRLRAQETLALVGLEDRLNHTPTELSGGQQQRVAIARSLINQPSIILADEPTGNLDTQTGAEIMALFRRLNRERSITMLFVTHDAETAATCHRTIFIRDGQIDRQETAETMPPSPLRKPSNGQTLDPQSGAKALRPGATQEGQ